MAIGKKIRQFEEQTSQTLNDFNTVFTDSPLNLAHLSPEAEVEIGEIVGPANVRKLLVDGKEIVHTFHIGTNFPSLMEEFLEDDSEAKALFNKSGASGGRVLKTNAHSENSVLTEKEAQLEPVEYVLLQYLRGCESPYHTQLEIADKLHKSVRGIREVISRMEKKNIIKTTSIVNMHRTLIKINEEWQ